MVLIIIVKTKCRSVDLLDGLFIVSKRLVGSTKSQDRSQEFSTLNVSVYVASMLERLIGELQLW